MDKGWRGASEINRVIYDPQQVDLGQLENWVKESGTYIKTIPADGSGGTTPEK